MVLGVATNLAPPAVAGLRMHDALAGAETFRQADAVWGGRMYAPTLERLGFQKVGWRRFYIDRE